MLDPNFWKEKTVVVTGGFGFLGNRVCLNLTRKGAKVAVLSRRMGCDLRSRFCAQYYFAFAKPDIVINCAAYQGGIGFQNTAPADIFDSNIQICLNTLWASWIARTKKYVNIIPNCVYPGYTMRGTMREKQLFEGSLHPTAKYYAMTKRAAIVQAQAYREQFRFNAISLVLTNLYGPREHFSLHRAHALAALVRKFYEAQRDNVPRVMVWGTGKPVREWLYVDDAAEGVVRAAELYNEGGPLNIAVGRGLTINTLAELIKDVVGYKGEIVYDTTKPDGAARKIEDIAKMKEVLDWEPQIPLKAGIEKTLVWFVENYDEIVAGEEQSLPKPTLPKLA